MKSSRASRASADRRAAPAATPFTRGYALLVAAVLALVASWAYSTSFAGVFLYDDKPAIVDNPNIKALWPLTRALSAPREVAVSARPIASLSLAINYALAPADVRDVMSPGEAGAPAGTADRFLRNIWGYHALNLTLHVLTALALFGVVRRSLLTPPLAPRFGQASASIAFAVALLWIVHPLLVDAVTYVVQRIEGLMGLFYLLMLYCAIRAWDAAPQATSQKPEARSTTSVRRWQALAVVCAALGMASKQVMVSAPIMVWLWDRTFAADRPPRRGFYLAVASTWIVLGALVAYERWPTSIGLDREGWTPWTYLLTESGVIVHYLRLALWPSPLVVDYDGWPMATSIMAVLPQATLLAVAAAVTILFVVRRAPWAFASLWCFMILAPSSSILPLYTEIAAERRAYLVVAGLIVLAVTGAYAAGRYLGRARVMRPLAWLAVVAIAATYATLTQARNRDFWSEEQIWLDAVGKRPDNSRARVNYGSVLLATGRFHEAETQLTEAVRLKPTNSAAHMNLGVVLCTLGRVDDGIGHLERAVALDPQQTEAIRDLGEAYATQGRLGPALEQFRRALDRRPNDVFLLNRAAWILATAKDDRLRNGAKAREIAERAVALTARRDVISLDTLAAAQAETGQFDLAARIAGEAIALARSQGNEAIVPEIGQRVMLYSQQRPFRQ